MTLITSVARAADKSSVDVIDIGLLNADNTGEVDASTILSVAVKKANDLTQVGTPACIHIPTGKYLIVTPPPEFKRAGCIRGDGAGQSIIKLSRKFSGVLFSWSEAWTPTTPGPRVTGLTIEGSGSDKEQNALVFYDRNDEVYINDVNIKGVFGRAIWLGAARAISQSYVRESHINSVRMFNDGAPGIPVLELDSSGTGITDTTNEVRFRDIDIYGPRGPGVLISNQGDGIMGGIHFDDLRVEGTENGNTASDLVSIGGGSSTGMIADLRFTNTSLVDPYPNHAAFHVYSTANGKAPYQIFLQASIGGGLSHGEGIVLDAGREVYLDISQMHTEGTNFRFGRNVSDVYLNAYGQEVRWTFEMPAATPDRIMLNSWRPLFQKDINQGK